MNLNALYEKVLLAEGLTKGEAFEVFEAWKDLDNQCFKVSCRLFDLVNRLDEVTTPWKNEVYGIDGLISADSMSSMEQLEWLIARSSSIVEGPESQ